VVAFGRRDWQQRGCVCSAPVDNCEARQNLNIWIKLGRLGPWPLLWIRRGGTWKSLMHRQAGYLGPLRIAPISEPHAKESVSEAAPPICALGVVASGLTQ